MAKIGKLTALQVKREKKKGIYGDGGNLYLQVHSPKHRSWIFRYELQGRVRNMGLGSLDDVTLAEAREKAREFRRLLLAGIDPLEQRRAAKAQAKLADAYSETFKNCAEAYVTAHRAGWRNPKSEAQWRETLRTYAYPVFGDLPVHGIDTGLVMRVLEPIWTTKHETANRLRGRIEAVLSWAKTRGYRTGENPAVWKGNLEHLLAKGSRVRQVQHHPAMRYQDIAAFIAELRQQGSVAARALEFTILTAARTGEVVHARWSEIDDDAKLWAIPADRTKTRKEHRVPLSPAAAEVIGKMRDIRQHDFIFPGLKHGRPIGDTGMLKLLEKMGRHDLTVHGFRSTFRDWAAEKTNHHHYVVEMALGHAIAGQVEAAYRRGDLFEKRRRLMDDWAAWCARAQSNGNNVVDLPRRA
jgi:integrase